MSFFRKRRDSAPCTIEVSNTFESLHAHVRFNNGATYIQAMRLLSMVIL